MDWTKFSCKCCGKGAPNPILKEKVEKLEVLLGEELFCNSGFRCEKHNKEVSGKPASTHLKGMAIDCRAARTKPKEIYLAMQSVGFGGIHAYETFCHGDVGPKRRW